MATRAGVLPLAGRQGVLYLSTRGVLSIKAVICDRHVRYGNTRITDVTYEVDVIIYFQIVCTGIHLLILAYLIQHKILMYATPLHDHEHLLLEVSESDTTFPNELCIFIANNNANNVTSFYSLVQSVATCALPRRSGSCCRIFGWKQMLCGFRITAIISTFLVFHATSLIVNWRKGKGV